MDVTSLLNDGAAAEAVQKQVEGNRIPGRNRTPWDAGGYALPLNTKRPLSPPSSQQQNIYQPDDSQIDTPTSPRHRFSDSRSSLSSYASSIHSANHSRFSSMSTVSGSHSLNTITAELFSPKSLPLSPSGVNSSDGLINEAHSFNTLSLSENLETLSTISEHRHSPEAEQDSVEESKQKLAVTEHPRPSSPSDAILIRRTTVPSLRLDTGGHEISGVDFQRQVNSNYLSAPIDRHHESLLHLKSHKRSASAPDFQAAMNEYSTKSVGPQSEPTPPSSYHPDNDSPTTPIAYPAPDTPPVLEEPVSDVVVCMYIPNCDTGSQPRKAISHIFGRNKMCTRLIPDHVWVHYCRKHYQRSRYRNPKEYAKLQCDLVQQQIRRIHAWSLANHLAGRPGTVHNWGLALRKREQQRLENLGGKRKRSLSVAGFDHDSDGDNAGDNGMGSTAEGGVPATAVPKWILEKMGKGYDTNAILAIFHRLHTEILTDELPCFPDIEILPNICVDDANPNTKEVKGYAKRNGGAHKRSRSLGVMAKSEYYSPSPSGRRPSQPGFWPPETSQTQKRRRQGEFEDSSPIVPSNTFPRRMQVAQRPVFANIEEHQMSESNYHHAPTFERSASYQGYQAPLPAPTPQRYAPQSMAAHLEIEHARPVQRGRQHQRSQSDMSAFVQHRYSVSPSYPVNMPYPGSSASSAGGSYFSNMHHAHEAPIHGQQYNLPQQRMQQSHREYRPVGLPAMGHARHQSSPMGAAGVINAAYGRQGHPMNSLPPVDMRHESPIYEAQQMRHAYPSHR